MAIKTNGNLIPSIQNTPLDARSVVDTIANIKHIQNPVLGGIFYCKEDGKHYKITSLKEKQIGGLVVQNAMVNTYEELCSSNVTLPNNITTQGNHFNTGDELVQLKNGKIPIELYDQPNLDNINNTLLNKSDKFTLFGENAIDVNDTTSNKSIKLKINDSNGILSQDASGLKTNLTLKRIDENSGNIISKYELRANR